MGPAVKLTTEHFGPVLIEAGLAVKEGRMIRRSVIWGGHHTCADGYAASLAGP
jgi:hypothetical protein